MPFFSSVVLLTIFRVVVPEEVLVLADESLPLEEEEEVAVCKDVEEGDFGRIGSGIR